MVLTHKKAPCYFCSLKKSQLHICSVVCAQYAVISKWLSTFWKEFESQFLQHKLVFSAKRRFCYLLNTLTHHLLFDSTDRSLGIPAHSTVIPRRFITLYLLKLCSQEKTSKKNTQLRYSSIFEVVVFLFSLSTGNSDLFDCTFCYCISHTES